jgi:hypothetical protein
LFFGALSAIYAAESCRNNSEHIRRMHQLEGNSVQPGQVLVQDKKRRKGGSLVTAKAFSLVSDLRWGFAPYRSTRLLASRVVYVS